MRISTFHVCMGAPMLYLAEPIAAIRTVEVDEMFGSLRFKSDGCEVSVDLSVDELGAARNAIPRERFEWPSGFLEGSSCLDATVTGDELSRTSAVNVFSDSTGGQQMVHACRAVGMPDVQIGTYSSRVHYKPQTTAGRRTPDLIGLQMKENEQLVCQLVGAVRNEILKLILPFSRPMEIAVRDERVIFTGLHCEASIKINGDLVETAKAFTPEIADIWSKEVGNQVCIKNYNIGVRNPVKLGPKTFERERKTGKIGVDCSTDLGDIKVSYRHYYQEWTRMMNLTSEALVREYYTHQYVCDRLEAARGRIVGKLMEEKGAILSTSKIFQMSPDAMPLPTVVVSAGDPDRILIVISNDECAVSLDFPNELEAVANANTEEIAKLWSKRVPSGVCLWGGSSITLRYAGTPDVVTIGPGSTRYHVGLSCGAINGNGPMYYESRVENEREFRKRFDDMRSLIRAPAEKDCMSYFCALVEGHRRAIQHLLDHSFRH